MDYWRTPLWRRLIGWGFRRQRAIHLRDEQARVVHPGGDLGAVIAGWSGRQMPYESWPLRRTSSR